MKKIYLILQGLLVFTLTHAQVAIEDSASLTRERWRDSLFRMNMTQVPTGILTEYSLFPFDTYRYDGVNNDDDTITNNGQLLMLHHVLTASKVNPALSLVATDSLFARAFHHKRTTGNIPFTLVYQPYNRIRQTALTQNLLKIAADSVGILDVPGRPSSPYDSYDFFALAPFADTIIKFNAVTFSFPSTLWQMTGVTTVSIDFNDGGGFRSIAPNGTVNIYYNTDGLKIVTARITVAGNTKTAKCRLYYRKPKSHITPSFTWNVEADYVYTSEDNYVGVPFAAQTLGIQSFLCGGSSFIQQLLCNIKPGANVVVENGCGSAFDKPIIIVEGFDPTGDLNIDVLRERFAASSFHDILASYGYDFVYVEFTNNGTFIENNAKVLEGVINKVNQMKTGSNPNIVIGFSMGGLIARWCLKDMEDRGITHNVSHYFSYDAPHQGANIPLGLQYLFQELENDLPYLRWNSEFRQVADGSRSPAAKQMMVIKANGFTTLDPVRASFAARLAAKGYPQLCTRYGMAFGRGNNVAGTKSAGNGIQWNNFGPGTRLLKANMTWFLVNFQSSTYAVQQNNINDYVLRYRFQGLTFKKIFGFPVIPVINIKWRNYKYTSPNSYDEAPGSFETTQWEFASNIDGWANGAARDATTDGHDGHNFLSTVSALDLTNQNYNAAGKWQSGALWANVDGVILNPNTVAGNNLSTPGLSPFQFVITATSNNAGSANLFHNTEIRAAFATFMIRKILNANPNFTCATNGYCNGYTPTITGNALVCNEETFQVPPFNGLTYNWQLSSSNAQIVSGQGTPVIRVKRITNGNSTLTITVTNACGSGKTASVVLMAGAPVASLLMPFGDNPVCPNVMTNYGVVYNGSSVCLPGTNKGKITSIEWQSDPANQIFLNQGMACPEGSVMNGGVQIRYGNFISWPSWVRVNATNGCGSSGWSNHLFINKLSFCAGMFTVNVTPNPTPDKVMITVEPAPGESQAQSPAVQQVRLFDVAGRLLQTFNYSGSQKRVQLGMSDYIPGTYIIEVWSGDVVMRKKVMIQR